MVVKKLRRSRTPFAVKFIPSGSIVLDCVLGGGWARGRVINIVGDRSTCKTALACEMIASVLVSKSTFERYPEDARLPKKVVYDVAEGSVDFDLDAMYGMKHSEIDWRSSDTVEEFDKAVADELSVLPGAPDGYLLVYILDSLDPLSCDAEIKFEAKKHGAMEEKEKEAKTSKTGKPKKEKKEKGTYGMDKAKLMNRFFRRNDLRLKQKLATLVIISQTRTKIGSMFTAKKRSCADALDFYESQELWLRETEKIEKKVGKRIMITGVRIHCGVKKNKVGKPYRDCYITFLFDYGLDNIGTNIDFLYDLIIKGKLDKEKANRKCLEWDGKEYTRQGLVDLMDSSEEQRRRLDQAVRERWASFEEAVHHGRKPKYARG